MWHISCSSTLWPIRSPFDDDAGSLALFLPQQIVIAEEAPVATGLSSTQQIPRFQIRQHLQGQFLGQQRYEVPLKLWFNHLHHMTHLRRLAQIYQSIQRQQTLWLRPTLKLHQPVTQLRRWIVFGRDYRTWCLLLTTRTWTGYSTGRCCCGGRR